MAINFQDCKSDPGHESNLRKKRYSLPPPPSKLCDYYPAFMINDGSVVFIFSIVVFDSYYTWMGGCPQTARKPSRYTTIQPRRTTQHSIPPGQVNRAPACSVAAV